MKGQGMIGAGGAGVGAVWANITLEDGSKWAFVGVVGGAELGFGAGLPVSGDFPGVDHMSGGCWVTIAGAAAGVIGEFQVSWSDTHGEIGTVNGAGQGLNISYAGGAGSWTKS